MKEVQNLVEQIKTDISNGKSEGEIFQSIFPLLRGDPQAGGELAEAVVAIPDQKIVKLLHRMLEVTQEKKNRKIIKRSLYRLKSKGVAMEEVFPDQKESILHPLRVESPKGFGNGYDFSWNRFLIITNPRPGRGLMVFHGVVNDTKGLVNFSGDEVSRKEFKNFFDKLEEASPTPVVEMEASYVGFLFTQGYQLTLSKGGTPPPNYLPFKSEVENIKKEYEKPFIYSCLSIDEIIGDDRLLKKGGDLLKTDLFFLWKIEENLIRPFAEEVWEAEESKIILNPTQKEARFQGIVQRALTDLFSGERKFLYQRRLEEMAYVFFKLGEGEEAKISLAVALDLEKPLNPIQPNPFLSQLVIKSIFLLLKESYEEKSKEPSLIIQP